MKPGMRYLLLACALVIAFAGLSLHRDSRGAFGVGAPAFALGITCPDTYDEPDNDGDECSDPGYSTQISSPKNLGGPSPDCPVCNLVGNPIDFSTGNKYEAELDYKGSGPFPISLVRYSNSRDFSGIHEFGAKWHSSYSRSLTVNGGSPPILGLVVLPHSVSVQRDDGKVFTFSYVAGTSTNPGILAAGVWKSEADVNARLSQTSTGWTYTSALDEVEKYDSLGRLVSITNRAGLTQTMTYDSSGRLQTIADPFGRTITLAYGSTIANASAARLITAATLPDGNIIRYGYDQTGRLTSVTHPDGGVRQYLYENTSYLNMLTGIVDERGNRYATFTYDANGLAISTEHAGGVDKYTVDYSGLASGDVTVTNPLGGVQSYILEGINGTARQDNWSRGTCFTCSYYNSTVNIHDANGNVTSTTDPTSTVTTYTYDLTRNLETSRTMAAGTSIARTISTTWHANFHLPTSVTDGTRAWTYSYDGVGNLTSVTLTGSAVSSTNSFTYNAAGQVLTATDPLGHVTRFSYDTSGNLTSTTNALGQVSQFTSYDANGRPLTAVDPNGTATSFTYNFRGQITSITLGQSRVTTLTYDLAGLLTQLTLPDGSSLTYSYDAAQRLVGISDSLGNRIAYTLDAAGNRLKEQYLAPGNVTQRTYSHKFDALARLANDVMANGAQSYYNYDAVDNITSYSDPNGVYRSFLYDALHRKTSEYFGSNRYFTYDLKGRLASIQDARSLTTQYAHNALDLLTSQVSPDTGGLQNTYDAAGNLLTSTDAKGVVTTYTYDALNRPLSISYSGGAAIQLQYDQGPNGIGHLTGMVDPSGATQWAYNKFGQVNAKQQVVGGKTLTTRWAFNVATGQMASMTYPSGMVLTYSYDTAGRVVAITRQSPGGSASPLLSQISYTPFGPVASWLAGNGATYTRTYDLDGRLTAIAMPAGRTMNLSYDSGYRITRITETGLAAKSYTYTSADRIATYTNGTQVTSYYYDAVGNRTQSSSTSPSTLVNYTYATSSNRLTSAGLSDSWTYDALGNAIDHKAGSSETTYAYNARNRQNGSTVVGSSARLYQLDGRGERVAKYDGLSGQYLTLFLYDDSGRLIGRYNGDGSLGEETVYLNDLPVGINTPTGALYIAPDHLGAPHQITDQGKSQVWLWDHDPWGNGQPSGTFSYNLRFPGQFYDTQTGNHYNYYRDYDPRIGRYIESDPIGLAGGINTYTYADGNPVNWFDQQGTIVLADNLIGAAIGAGSYVAAQYLKSITECQPFEIKTGDLLVAAGVGFATSGLSAVAGRFAGGFITRTLLNAGIGAGGGVITAAAHNYMYNGNDNVLSAGAWGSLGGGIGSVVTDAVPAASAFLREQQIASLSPAAYNFYSDIAQLSGYQLGGASKLSILTGNLGGQFFGGVPYEDLNSEKKDCGCR